MITNEDNDYEISPEGFRVNALSQFTNSTAYTIYEGVTLVGRLYGTSGLSSRVRLDALDDYDLDLISTNDINLSADNINLDATDRIEISSINEVALLSDTRVTTNARFQLRTMNETQRDNLTGNQAGDVIYNTTTARPNYFDGTIWKNF